MIKTVELCEECAALIERAASRFRDQTQEEMQLAAYVALKAVHTGFCAHPAECPSCASPDHSEPGLVPGGTGQPVSCTDRYHEKG